MDDLEKLTDKLEYLFLRKLIDQMKGNTIELGKVKELANEFLGLEPFLSVEDAQQKIARFTTDHTEYTEAKKYADAYLEEQHVDAKVEQMRNLLKEDKLDEAISVAKA